jgi:F-type H+-transporting ATPase subunit a
MMLLQAPDIGEMVLHHTADSWPFGCWPGPCQGQLTFNLLPTKHVGFMLLSAVLVFLSIKLAGMSVSRQTAAGKAPRGFSAAMEGLVLWVRDDIAIANIGHKNGARLAPLIVALFFFILYCNLLGLFPYGSVATGNLAVTSALALLSFVVIELGGLITLGPMGYLRSIFPHIPGMSGGGALLMSIVMAPFEVIGKLVKPFALAVRLFGNMTAGHFVILSLFGIIFLFGRLGALSWGIGLVTALLVLGIMLLEIIVALLQAYVFALLTAVFIGLLQEEH